MKKYISVSWIIFCYMTFAGCTQFATKGVPQDGMGPRVESSSDVARLGQTDMLLKFMQRFTAMSPEKQKREYAGITGLRRSEYSRMQLALIHGLPGSRFRDITRAQSLIDEHLKAADSKDAGLRSLATMLKNQLNEQQKLEETVTQMTQKLKDEQKKSETLQRQIDELLAVEKTMTDRLRGSPK